MKKGISVIIPTYNSESLIKEAIQSVINQEYKDKVEIIVSDDGSSDNTLSIVEEFKEQIKIVKKPKDCTTQGVSGTRNRGIKASTQPFICFLDSDDFFLPEHFEKMICAFEKEKRLGFVFCRVLEEKEENDSKLLRPWTRKYVLKNDIKNPVVSRSKIVHTNSFMLRREVFDHVGYFNESYSNGEDGDQWMRISEKFKGTFSDHFGAAYRTNHGINQLTKNPGDQINRCALLIFEEAKKRYYDLKLNDPKKSAAVAA